MANSTDQTNQKVNRFGLFWPAVTPMITVHLHFIRQGGFQKKSNGEMAGAGMAYHMREAQSLLWPNDDWHPWRELTLKSFCENRLITVLGPASSGKSHDAALFGLTMYYAQPDCCTVLCTSTTREMLENRVFGEIKNRHLAARRRYDFIPGYLIESRQRILTDSKKADTEIEGRDFRNGIQGVPTMIGQTFRGLGSFIGIKNKVLILIADEGSLLPRIFVDAIANLNKNQGFKGVILGNPLDITDALGVAAEPAAHLGGWDGGIDQTGGTKTWPTRFKEGIAVQLVGTDSPNLKVPAGEPEPFPYLITRAAIDADIQFYGKESIQFTSMNEGRMPKGMAARRVITRQMCLRFGTMEEPVWMDTKRTRIGFLDAAYGGTGGDRCVYGELDFGMGIDPNLGEIPIMALIDTMIVQIISGDVNTPEEKIALFVKSQNEQRGIVPINFFFDSTGRGSLMNAFGRLYSAEVQGVEFGGSASERMVRNILGNRQQTIMAYDYYKNRVTELWFQFREVAESRQFRGLREDVLNELIMREWGNIPGSNKIQVEIKEKMKLKVGRSPDLADAVVVGVEGAIQRGFAVRQMVAQNKNPSSDDHWKDEWRKRSQEIKRSGELQEV